MKMGKIVIGTGIAIGMLSSSVAMAAETRSAGALPGVHAASKAPVQGVRTSKKKKLVSAADGDGSSGTGYIIGGLAAAAVVAGIVVVASDNDDNNDDSNG